jgi:hypothetical protein
MKMTIPFNTDRQPSDFKIGSVKPITSRFDMQYCILAKGIDPNK